MLDFGFYNMDCMAGMATFPDNYFDLAIVDPPYGIGYDKQAAAHGGQQYGNAAAPHKTYHSTNWDAAVPGEDYFNELFRVSKNQIIFGGNYFIDRIKRNSPCWIVWDKETGANNYADAELAWTSFNSPVRQFRYLWKGMLQGDMKNKEVRIHPTQKPVALYKWILSNYASPGDKILDTHAGSASSLVACYDLGFDFVGFEIDEEYYRLASERLDAVKAQLRFDLEL